MSLLDAVFPKRCVECGRVGQYVCFNCRKLAVPINWNETICPVCGHAAFEGMTHPNCTGRYTPDGLTGMFRYRSVIRRGIAAIKYRFVSDMVEELIGLIPPPSYRVVERMCSLHHSMMVLPIPLHPSRLRHRGFNQAEVLGCHIARYLGIPLETGILRRVKATVPQVSAADRSARFVNMNHAFESTDPTAVRGSAYILVDDVFTTGATARAACSALKHAGAKFVWIVTLAR